MTDVYRRAASILVIKPVEDSYHILLLHKPRKKDAWQLPQGGVEGEENVTQAALRELNEEASLKDCNVLGVSPRFYQYDFPDSYRRFRPDNVKGQHISFVFALAPMDAAVTVDEKEVDSYVWIDVAQLGQYLKRDEYLNLVKGLYEEALKALNAKH
ncbi:NUDIX hydrolase [Candidatus Peribacteria bacterium]|nr:NUDIX hydrolase [Candidatus Peribacteria bacterium]